MSTNTKNKNEKATPVNMEAQPEIRVKNTNAFKLKDKFGKNYRPINFIKEFGFLPETIIIEKVHGRSNCMIVRAVLTQTELDKEERMKKAIVKNKIIVPGKKN
jgi:hypothetical protein|tara:strand:- start:554 stop:862 length:309 start_codon:yes stop_codon:yes gene_type:complete